VALRFAVAVAVMLWLAPARSFAQGRPAPLQGVDAVTVKVSIAAPPDILPNGLTVARLQTLVELKLRAWTLRVMPAAEDAMVPGIRPHVELEVTMLETRAVQKLAGYAFFMRLVVGEAGTSLRNGASVLNELWSHSFLNVSDQKTVVADMERSTGELVDQFVNEWLRTRHPLP
jgi:hypothetical protein